MPEPATTDTPATEETGETSGAGAGTGDKPAGGEQPQTPAAQELEGFTPEQKKRIEDIVTARLDRAKDSERKKQEREQRDRQQAEAIQKGELQPVIDQLRQQNAELEARAAKAERDSLIARVAARHKLPDDIAARLVGATEDELDADAKKLAAMLVPPKAPVTEAGAGNKPNGAPRNPVPPAQGGNQQQTYAWQSASDVKW